LLKRGLISHVFYRYIRQLFSHKIKSLSTRLNDDSLSVGWFQVNWSAGQGDPNKQMRPEIVDDILYAAVRLFFFSLTARIAETSNQKIKRKPIGNGWHNFSIIILKIKMNNWLKTLIAGYAGWKWGGGCLGFIVVFAIVYFFLGHC
jgi:hypothetical protein